jgi:hypothetical protein
MMGTTSSCATSATTAKAERVAGFRPDIFENYECDEPIEED